MIEYKMNPSLNDDFDKKEPGKGVWSPSALPTEPDQELINLAKRVQSLLEEVFPPENHYFDTSCQKCGHVPQGETHLCGWEHDGTLHFRKLEHMQKICTAGWEMKLQNFIDDLLLTQRQEIVEMIEGMTIDLSEHGDAKFIAGFNYALFKLSERIGVHKSDEK
jgi:hypothetical protein